MLAGGLPALEESQRTGAASYEVVSIGMSRRAYAISHLAALYHLALTSALSTRTEQMPRHSGP
jgi:hypothetical protein